MANPREAVLAFGAEVRAARARLAERQNVYKDEEADYERGFIESAAKLSGLLADTIFKGNTEQMEGVRRLFLKDLGFDGEQVVG